VLAIQRFRLLVKTYNFAHALFSRGRTNLPVEDSPLPVGCFRQSSGGYSNNLEELTGKNIK
jgi:hypothetical protein